MQLNAQLSAIKSMLENSKLGVDKPPKVCYNTDTNKGKGIDSNVKNVDFRYGWHGG